MCRGGGVKKSYLTAAVTAGALILSLAGCAEPPGTEPGTGASAPGGSAAAGEFKACMVSDAGGFDDKSFNQTSYKGLTDAAEELGIETGEVESHAAADYPKNIQSMVDAGCSIIVTVGFLLSDDTVAAAKANPDIDFAIVDNNVPEVYSEIDNLKPLVFNTAESSFLAGYLAAAMTKTGKVGTFGGAKIPTVTIFMDGFAQGVEHFNTEKGKQVQVLGWNAEKQDGQFVPGDDPFGNDAGGKQIGTNLISQGADIIFPVAGPAGLGGLQAAQASGGKVNAIWVDTDGCVSAANYCDILVSSVTKGMDVAVKNAIVDSKNGEMTNEPYVGTLENEGTGLAPFHEFEDKVPAEVKTEIEQLQADIIAGKIKITSESQPS
jgi:basic membrane protein A